jgi:hypothetical protein
MSKTKIFLNLSIYWVLVIRLGLVFCCCRRQRNKKDVDLTSFLFISLFFIEWRPCVAAPQMIRHAGRLTRHPTIITS